MAIRATLLSIIVRSPSNEEFRRGTVSLSANRPERDQGEFRLIQQTFSTFIRHLGAFTSRSTKQRTAHK